MILVVDDHEDTRYVLTRLLKKLDCESVGVSSGAEALLLLKSQQPKLIILDYNMPDMNGLEVLRSMRADPQLSAIPVVMFSADASPELQAASFQAGAQGYVTKGSLDWAELSVLIDRYACKTTGKPGTANDRGLEP